MTRIVDAEMSSLRCFEMYIHLCEMLKYQKNTVTTDRMYSMSSTEL